MRGRMVDEHLACAAEPSQLPRATLTESTASGTRTYVVFSDDCTGRVRPTAKLRLRNQDHLEIAPVYTEGQSTALKR